MAGVIVVFVFQILLFGFTRTDCPEPCNECKEISSGDYQGTWSLIETNSSSCQKPKYGKMCLYQDTIGRNACMCDPGNHLYTPCGGNDIQCYPTGQNCSVGQCLAGYECCFDGFCCQTCPPTIEDTFKSLEASDLQCIPKNCNQSNCPGNSECCFGTYCCPYGCPVTEEDAANSTLAASSFVSCENCEEACELGATYFKDHVCDLLPWPLDGLCDAIIPVFTQKACQVFCFELIC